MTQKELLDWYGIKYPVCGFDIGPGWMTIVRKAFQAMLAAGWRGGLSQVKEKFGGLRIYWDPAYNEDDPDATETDEQIKAIDAIVRQAEAESWSTCEECGSTDDVGTGPTPRPKWTYIRSLCPDCHAKRDLTR